jgi:hypothetical protein
MTPTLPEILRGNFMSLALPATPDMAGQFMTARVSVIALLNLLAAQEAERGTAGAVLENRLIAELLAGAPAYAIAAPAPTDDPAPAAIDAHNATLRRALIALHEAVEARGDAVLEARILALYVAMAEGRELILPPLPG